MYSLMTDMTAGSFLSLLGLSPTCLVVALPSQINRAYTFISLAADNSANVIVEFIK